MDAGTVNMARANPTTHKTRACGKITLCWKIPWLFKSIASQRFGHIPAIPAGILEQAWRHARRWCLRHHAVVWSHVRHWMVLWICSCQRQMLPIPTPRGRSLVDVHDPVMPIRYHRALIFACAIPVLKSRTTLFVDRGILPVLLRVFLFSVLGQSLHLHPPSPTYICRIWRRVFFRIFFGFRGGLRGEGCSNVLTTSIKYCICSQLGRC